MGGVGDLASDWGGGCVHDRNASSLARRQTPIMEPVISRRLLAIASLVVLSVLTTGMTVFERGLFQDDTQVFLRTFVAPGGTVQAMTRRSRARRAGCRGLRMRSRWPPVNRCSFCGSRARC